MSYTNDELSRIVDSLRVRVDQLKFGDNGPPPDLNAPDPNESPADFTYAGPGYPRITVEQPGVRRVTLDVNTTVLVEEFHAEHMASATRPPVYPSVNDLSPTHRGIWYLPGIHTSIRTAEMDASTGRPLSELQLNLILRRLIIIEEDVLEEAPGEFSGDAAFYFHPDDMELPVTDREAAQGLLPGDPDYGVVETAPTGAGLSEGYRGGTQGSPYRPWDDEDSVFYGMAVRDN